MKKKDKEKTEIAYKGKKNDLLKKVVKEPPPKELPMDDIRPIEEKKKVKFLIMMK